MLVHGSQLWLPANDPALYQIDADTGKVVHRSGTSSYFDRGNFYGIAADSKHIWVTNSSLGQLAEFLRSSDALVRVYS
jgi:hypothetical protein